jgi:hypothetical protein
MSDTTSKAFHSGGVINRRVTVKSDGNMVVESNGGNVEVKNEESIVLILERVKNGGWILKRRVGTYGELIEGAFTTFSDLDQYMFSVFSDPAVVKSQF